MNPSSLYQRVGAVALIRFQSGRVNSLSLSLRQWLSHALTVAQGDEAVRAIVLMGEGGVFSAGADVTEFNTPAASTEPTLPSVIEQVAKSAKPVVAAIDGVAYGGGLELALACQQRLLSSRAKLALPEVTLGLVPGAGGTQRLPRVVGLSCALDMVSTGRPVAAEEAVAIGLGEGLSDEDLAAAACAYAQGLALVPVLSDAPALPLGTDEEALLQQAYARVAKTQRGFMAPKVAIDCVAASTRLGLNAGLAYERQQFDRLVQGQETQALRHLFFAQRQAAKTAVTEPLPPIRTIAVVGGGLMGTGISINAADAGLPVLLLEQDAEALAKALARIKAHYQRQVAQGRLAQAAATAKTALIVGTLVEQEVAEVDLVIEAVFEDMTLKQSVLARLDAVCGPDTLIASNTSRLDINLLASSTQRPQQVLGMHFFSPANVMRLLEVVRGSETAPVTVARVMALAKRLNKVAVVVGVCEGFVGNRMLSPYQREALFLLEEGASVAQVDGALYGFGMAMGPFVMSDMAGLDIGWAARKRLAPTRDPRRRYS
nr:enoyl-CoA hydratase/isomerase family protein [Neisseriaceae bacterium]